MGNSQPGDISEELEYEAKASSPKETGRGSKRE